VFLSAAKSEMFCNSRLFDGVSFKMKCLGSFILYKGWITPEMNYIYLIFIVDKNNYNYHFFLTLYIVKILYYDKYKL